MTENVIAILRPANTFGSAFGKHIFQNVRQLPPRIDRANRTVSGSMAFIVFMFDPLGYKNPNVDFPMNIPIDITSRP